MIAVFKSGAEKLSGRLADLETEAEALAKRAETARAAEAEAQARLVEDLAEGLDVGKWREKRDAAEKKAADAERDMKAAQDAAEIVRGRLEKVRAAELLGDLKRRYVAAQERLPAVLEDFRRAGRTFAQALARLEGLRREEDSVIGQLRTAGDRETQLFGVPHSEDVLAGELVGPEEGRKLMTIRLSVWPSTGGA